MGEPLIEEFLAGDSREIRDLANNEAALVGFLTLAKGIDDLPNVSARFYEDSRSLYQVTSSGYTVDELVQTLSGFFGDPAKAPGKGLPVSLRFDPTVKFLGGIRKDQALFLKKIKTGAFFGALWPWQRDRDKIEVLLGFCSTSMSDADYDRLGTLVKKFLSKKKIESISDVGGQIHGISLPSFLQMSEMEGATYTLRVTSGSRVGHLYLDDGSLIAADYDNHTGNEAAYRIISWDNAAIQIQPADPHREREIHDPLMHVMMESLKIKDEAGAQPEPVADEPQSAPASEPPPQLQKKRSKKKSRKQAPPPETPEPTPEPPSAPPEEPKPAVPFKRAEDHSIGRQAQMSRTKKLLIVLGVVIVFAVSVTVGGNLLKKRQLNRRYDRLIADLAVTKELDAQVVLLMQYIKSFPNDRHRSELEARLEETNAEIEKRDYEKTILDVSRLPIDDNYEKKALSLYTAFLTKHPQSAYTKQINKAISGIRQLLGAASFEDLKRFSTTDLIERYAAYREYLDQFPEGAERETVEGMIADLAQEYHQAIQKQVVDCDAQQDWSGCIAECDRFLSVFSDDVLAPEVKQLRAALRDKADVAALIARAAQVPNDVTRARRIYTDYLDNHPQTSQRETILQRIDALNVDLNRKATWEKTKAFATNPANDIISRLQRLDSYIQNHASGTYAEQAQALMTQLEPERQAALRAQRAEAQRRQEQVRRQAEAAQRAKAAQRIQQLQDQVAAQLRPVAIRFISNKDGTVFDQVTGLTWTLLDSHLALGRCMDYRDAKAYIQQMNTGGHRDWRLPTAGELASIYKNRPFFPDSGAAWYWTSESFARGYHRVVDVVTSEPEPVFTRTSKTEDSCGAVRAVRR